MIKRILLNLALALTLTSTLSGVVLAQTRPPIIPPGVDQQGLVIPHQEDKNASAEQDFGGRLLPAITNVVIGAGGACSVLFIVIGSIQILTAYGDEEKIGTAKKTITYAIVGLVISMLSYAVVSIISAINLNPIK